EAVDDARQHIAGLVVGAEPVPVADRAGGVCGTVEITAAARLRVIEPGGFGRRGFGDVVVDGAVGIADRRPDQPAIGFYLLADDRIAIIGDGEEAAELLFGVV